MVIISGARNCSVARSAQPGKRSSYECAWSCRCKLALARPRRHAVVSGVSMAAGFDREFQSRDRICNIRQRACRPRFCRRSNLNRREVSLVIQVAKSILLVVSALFPIVDPIGGAPVFLLLTQDYAPETRRVLARRIALDSFILLIASYTLGAHVLSFFGISLPVVQVGGGLIVISTGWAMLNQKDEDERKAVGRTVNCTDALRDAFYPLTLPLTVGPGSISIAITLGANEPHQLRASLVAILAAAIGCAFVAATIYLCYGFADRLAGVMGPAGMNVILRLSSFLVVCIGVQIVWNGTSKLLSTVPYAA